MEVVNTEQFARSLHPERRMLRPEQRHRNGTTPKTIQTDTSALRLAVPSDQAGHLSCWYYSTGGRLPGLDEKVIALYPRGLTRTFWSCESSRRREPSSGCGC